MLERQGSSKLLEGIVCTVSMYNGKRDPQNSAMKMGISLLSMDGNIYRVNLKNYLFLNYYIFLFFCRKVMKRVLFEI